MLLGEAVQSYTLGLAHRHTGKTSRERSKFELGFKVENLYPSSVDAQRPTSSPTPTFTTRALLQISVNLISDFTAADEHPDISANRPLVCIAQVVKKNIYRSEHDQQG